MWCIGGVCGVLVVWWYISGVCGVLVVCVVYWWCVCGVLVVWWYIGGVCGVLVWCVVHFLCGALLFSHNNYKHGLIDCGCSWVQLGCQQLFDCGGTYTRVTSCISPD